MHYIAKVKRQRRLSAGVKLTAWTVASYNGCEDTDTDTVLPEAILKPLLPSNGEHEAEINDPAAVSAPLHVALLVQLKSHQPEPGEIEHSHEEMAIIAV